MTSNPNPKMTGGGVSRKEITIITPGFAPQWHLCQIMKSKSENLSWEQAGQKAQTFV
jgi:hypothetical protein